MRDFCSFFGPRPGESLLLGASSFPGVVRQPITYARLHVHLFPYLRETVHAFITISYGRTGNSFRSPRTMSNKTKLPPKGKRVFNYRAIHSPIYSPISQTHEYKRQSNPICSFPPHCYAESAWAVTLCHFYFYFYFRTRAKNPLTQRPACQHGQDVLPTDHGT